MPEPLTLFSTDACTLCERALDLLLSMDELSGMRLEVVDIADDEKLFDKYADVIPVLQIGDQTLHAPFGRDEVAQFISRSREPE